MAAQDALHHEIGTDELMAARVRAGDPENAGHWNGVVHRGHVAGLARSLIVKVAMLPLLIDHLFRQGAHYGSACIARLGDQGVTARAQLGRLDLRSVLRLISLRGASHDLLQAGRDFIGPKLGMRAVCRRATDHEVTVIALGGAQTFRRDLVTDRTGHTIGVFFARVRIQR